MEKQSRYEDRRELIFNSSAKSVKSAQVHEMNFTNDQVDLEIILLGPKTNKTKHDNRPTNSTRSTNTNEDIDLRELDPYHPAKESSPAQDVEDNGGSLTQKSPSSNQTSREHDKKSSNVSRSANNISSSLLDQMERQFRENISSRAEDEEQIDYLDYF